MFFNSSLMQSKANETIEQWNQIQELNLSSVELLNCPAHLEQPEQLYVNLSTFWYAFLALITTIGLVISLVSNMIIIYLFTSNPSNIVAVNLSLSDLLYCIQWPSVIYCCLTQSTWVLEHKLVCQSFGFITVSTAMASVLTVLMMSIERAIVIIYSIQAKNRFTIRFAWLITVLIWLISVCSCIPPLFGKFNRYTLDPSKTSCTLDYLSRQENYKLYILILYVAFWIIPGVIITISYILIIVTFKKSSLSLKRLVSDDNQANYCCDSNSSMISHKTVDSQRNQFGSTSSKVFPFNSSSIVNFQHNYPTQQQQQGSEVSSLKLKHQLQSNCNFSRVHLDRRASASFIDFDKVRREVNGTNTSCSISEQKRSKFKRVASSSNLLRRQDSIRLPQEVANSTSATNSEVSYFKMAINPLRAFGRSSTRSNFSRRQESPNTTTKTTSALEDGHTIGIQSSSRGIQLLRSRFRARGLTQSANSQMTRTILQFRLAKMSFYLILLWLVSWTPIASLAVINSLKSCHKASAIAVFLASTMTKLGPALDVFIYGISHPKIKSRFIQIIRSILTLGRNHSTMDINEASRMNSFKLNTTVALSKPINPKRIDMDGK